METWAPVCDVEGRGPVWAEASAASVFSLTEPLQPLTVIVCVRHVCVMGRESFHFGVLLRNSVLDCTEREDTPSQTSLHHRKEYMILALSEIPRLDLEHVAVRNRRALWNRAGTGGPRVGCHCPESLGALITTPST